MNDRRPEAQNPEQKQTQRRCNVAEDQILAVNKEKQIGKRKKKRSFARPKVCSLFELLRDHGYTEGLESGLISTAR